MLTLTDEQKCLLAVEFKTAAGNLARVDGAPEWSVSNEDVLDIVPAEDGLSATVLAKGPIGNGQVRVTADADLGEGIRHIYGVLDVDVVASEATSVIVVAGAPELITPPAPEPEPEPEPEPNP